jgi:hypothetical protein
MSPRPTRSRLALAVAVAALVALVGAGQAVAAMAPPDERVLERHLRLGDLDAAEQPSQGSPARAPRRHFRPEPQMAPPQQSGDAQVAPAPTAAVPAGGRGGLVVIVVLVALLLAVGASAWRVRHRRPHPESTA